MSNKTSANADECDFQESWKVAHIEAMECVSLEEIISDGLEWFAACPVKYREVLVTQFNLVFERI